MPKYRDRPVVSVTLTPESIAILDELALVRGLTRSTMRERKKRGMKKVDHEPGPRR
jgi:hypothetical protein